MYAPLFILLLTLCREDIFALLGFPVETLPHTDGKLSEPSLQPPSIDPATPKGQETRTKLLRVWVELSAWLAIYEKSSTCGISKRGPGLINLTEEHLGSYNAMVLSVTADSARDMYQSGIGAHVSQSKLLVISKGSTLSLSWASSFSRKSSRSAGWICPIRRLVGDAGHDAKHILLG